MLAIKQTENINKFIGLPFKTYNGSPFYAPELKSDLKFLFNKNPFWQHAGRALFIAERGGEPVGRIAAIVNRAHNKHWNDTVGFFGFFECENNKETAKALIDSAKAWLKQEGLTSIRGPVNPSTNYTCGVLADNFDQDPFIMMPYNHAYYHDILLDAGLKKAKDLLAFERTDKDDFSPRMKKIIERILKNKSINIRPINVARLNEEARIIRGIYNAAWTQNWGFVPMTEPEIDAMAKQLKMIIRPELTCIIEYDGKTAGFAIAIPNMNCVLKILRGSLFNPLRVIRALFALRGIKDCRMIMLGVHPDYRGKGLELLLVRQIVEEGVKRGWNHAELSWMLEDNKAIISVIEESGCRKTKTYRIYESEL